MAASSGRRRGPRGLAADAAGRLPWVVDVYRAARNPRWARDLRRDLDSTRDAVGFLRELPAPAADDPVALVGLYRDHVYEAKLGLMLATALRLRGYRPIVSIPSNRADRLRRYAAAFGVADVVVHDRVEIRAAERRELDEVRDALLGGSLDFETIKKWTFRDYPIGAHVLSTLIRVTFDGSPDLHLDGNRARLGPILDEVLENVVRDERLFDDLSPAVLLVDEANYSVNGPLVDVAVRRGVDVLQTVPTWRDDCLMSKRITTRTRRMDAHSVSPETFARVLAVPWGAEQDAELDADFEARYSGTYALGRQYQPATVTRTADEIRDELGLDPDKPTCVIFAHVLWDASLFFGVDLFANYSDWLVQTVTAAAANPAVNWVVKAHPSNVFRATHGFAASESSELTLIRESFPTLPEHISVLSADTKISTRSLYSFADVGVTVRGTPGMEMPCFGKPMLTAGTGSYSGLGFTLDSTSRDEYLARLARVHEYGPISSEMRLRARQHLHALLIRRPWETGAFRVTFNFREGQWHPLDQNLVVTARDTQELDELGDLGEWASWVADSLDTDFVPEERW